MCFACNTQACPAFYVSPAQVTDLRQKARLLVPDAVTLVGVMDEFGVLDEGEVFVQVRQVSTYQLHQKGCK